MRKLSVVGFLFLTIGVVPACTTPGESVSAVTAGPVSFKRANLVVADLDRALTIYRDILGFSVDRIAESGTDSYSYPTFRIPRDALLRFATLSTRDQVRTLALTEIRGMDLPPQTGLARSALVIRVNKLEDAVAKIGNLGLEVIAPEYSKTPEGIEFAEQAFFDYDGNLVVLYELRD